MSGSNAGRVSAQGEGGLTGQLTFEQRSEQDEGERVLVTGHGRYTGSGAGRSLPCVSHLGVASATCAMFVVAQQLVRAAAGAWFGCLRSQVGAQRCLHWGPGLCCPVCQPLATRSSLNVIETGTSAP